MKISNWIQDRKCHLEENELSLEQNICWFEVKLSTTAVVFFRTEGKLKI